MCNFGDSLDIAVDRVGSIRLVLILSEPDLDVVPGLVDFLSKGAAGAFATTALESHIHDRPDKVAVEARVLKIVEVVIVYLSLGLLQFLVSQILETFVPSTLVCLDLDRVRAFRSWPLHTGEVVREAIPQANFYAAIELGFLIWLLRNRLRGAESDNRRRRIDHERIKLFQDSPRPGFAQAQIVALVSRLAGTSDENVDLKRRVGQQRLGQFRERVEVTIRQCGLVNPEIREEHAERNLGLGQVGPAAARVSAVCGVAHATDRWRVLR